MGHRSLRRSLVRDERGSLYVEMIFFIPMALLIWVLLNFVYDAKKTAVHTQRDARQCAWEYALSGCKGALPAACEGGAASMVTDAPLRAAASGSFEKLASAAPFAAASFQNLHGRWFRVTAEREVTRPTILGGTTTAEGRFAVMCADDPPIRWSTTAFFKAFCEKHSKWCP